MAKCPTCGQELPVTPPSTGKIFPHRIVFERESDEGYGVGAIVLFPSLADADVTYVSVNGEIAKKAHPYNGHPVFTLTKPGDQYLRPLKFVIKMSDGSTYTKEGEAATPATPDTPSGGHSETVGWKGCGNPDGAKCRRNFRFRHPGSYYGKTPTVYLDGAKKLPVKDSAKRQEGANGIIWKPKSDSDGKLVGVGEYAGKHQKCTVTW